MYEVIGKKNIAFARLNLEIHALAQQESVAIRNELENEPLMTNQEVLKDMIKSQFTQLNVTNTNTQYGIMSGRENVFLVIVSLWKSS